MLRKWYMIDESIGIKCENGTNITSGTVSETWYQRGQTVSSKCPSRRSHRWRELEHQLPVSCCRQLGSNPVQRWSKRWTLGCIPEEARTQDHATYGSPFWPSLYRPEVAPLTSAPVLHLFPFVLIGKQLYSSRRLCPSDNGVMGCHNIFRDIFSVEVNIFENLSKHFKSEMLLL